MVQSRTLISGRYEIHRLAEVSFSVFGLITFGALGILGTTFSYGQLAVEAIQKPGFYDPGAQTAEVIDTSTQVFERGLFEMYTTTFVHTRLKTFSHELDVLRVRLVFVLSLFVGKGKVERHLVGLVNHRAMAAHHFPDVKLQYTGDGFEILESASEEFLGGIGLSRISPEYDNV